MKKYKYKPSVFKKIGLKRMSRRREYFLWRKSRNNRSKGIPKRISTEQNKINQKKWIYEEELAPKDLRINSNTNEVIIFINKLEDHFNKKRKVFVVLKNVVDIDYGAILILLSTMIKFKSNNIDFNGDFPKNEKAKLLLGQSGFFKCLSKPFKDEERYAIFNNGKNEIVTHAWKNVDSLLSAEIIRNASKTVWGESRRCQGVQRALLELMQNTNNHASVKNKGEKHWWLYVYHDEDLNKASFVFVDFGIGVFNSLDNKTSSSKWFNWIQKISKIFSFKSNSELLKMIMSGEFHQTVTGKYYRGKGLPGVSDVEKRGQIRSLKIITNNVHAEVSNGLYNELSASFQGTYVFWEIDNECKNAV